MIPYTFFEQLETTHKNFRRGLVSEDTMIKSIISIMKDFKGKVTTLDVQYSMDRLNINYAVGVFESFNGTKCECPVMLLVDYGKSIIFNDDDTLLGVI